MKGSPAIAVDFCCDCQGTFLYDVLNYFGAGPGHGGDVKEISLSGICLVQTRFFAIQNGID